MYVRKVYIFPCIAVIAAMKARRSDGLIAKTLVMINNFKLNKKNAFVCMLSEASNMPLICCMVLVTLGNQIHALEHGRRNSL